MAGYTLLRNSYNFTITSGTGFTDSDAKGSASLEFQKQTSGVTSLPQVGDTLKNVGYYAGGGLTTTFLNIYVKSIKQKARAFNHSGNAELWSYIVTYSSSSSSSGGWGAVNQDFLDFTASLQVIAVDDPVNWRYAEKLTAANPPTTGTPIVGNVDQRMSKVIVVGDFKQRKVVKPSEVDAFFTAYLKVAGKLNVVPIDVEMGSGDITFAQGQLLVGSFTGGEQDGDNFIFNVTYHYKLIRDKNATKTEDITKNDWQYVWAPVGGGDAGFLAPIQVNGSTKDTAETDPWIYQYCTAAELEAFMADDYSEEPPAP
jgi:hypothetical protein